MEIITFISNFGTATILIKLMVVVITEKIAKMWLNRGFNVHAVPYGVTVLTAYYLINKIK